MSDPGASDLRAGGPNPQGRRGSPRLLQLLGCAGAARPLPGLRALPGETTPALEAEKRNVTASPSLGWCHLKMPLSAGTCSRLESQQLQLPLFIELVLRAENRPACDAHRLDACATSSAGERPSRSLLAPAAPISRYCPAPPRWPGLAAISPKGQPARHPVKLLESALLGMRSGCFSCCWDGAAPGAECPMMAGFCFVQPRLRVPVCAGQMLSPVRPATPPPRLSFPACRPALGLRCSETNRPAGAGP